MKDIELDIVENDSGEPDCTGLVFKLSINNYYNKTHDYFSSTKTMRLQKRKSCKCPICEFTLDQIKEMQEQGALDSLDRDLKNIEDTFVDYDCALVFESDYDYDMGYNEAEVVDFKFTIRGKK